MLHAFWKDWDILVYCQPLAQWHILTYKLVNTATYWYKVAYTDVSVKRICSLKQQKTRMRNALKQKAPE